MNRSTTIRRSLAACLVAAAFVCVASSAASAQNETVFRPTAPAPAKSGEPPLIRGMLLLAVIAGIGIGAQTIPSKRGHQD